MGREHTEICRNGSVTTVGESIFGTYFPELRTCVYSFMKHRPWQKATKHNSPPLVPVLSKLNPVQALPPQFFTPITTISFCLSPDIEPSIVLELITFTYRRTNGESKKDADKIYRSRRRPTTFRLIHTKAAPNGKCCEGYIVPSIN